MMANKKRKGEHLAKVIVNPFSKNISNIGRRTGKNILEGKTIRKDEHGMENFDDYWSDQSGSADSYADWIEKKESKLSAEVSVNHTEISPIPSLNSTLTPNESVAQDGDNTLVTMTGLLQGGNSDGSITSHTESKISHLEPPSALKNFKTKKRLRYSALVEKKLEEAEQLEKEKTSNSEKKRGSKKFTPKMTAETPPVINNGQRSLRSSSKKLSDINHNIKDTRNTEKEQEIHEEPAAKKSTDDEDKSKSSPRKNSTFTKEHTSCEIEKNTQERQRLRKMWNEDEHGQTPSGGNTMIIEINQNEKVPERQETENQNKTVTIAVSKENMNPLIVENSTASENEESTRKVLGTISFIEDPQAEDSDDFEVQSIDENQKFIVKNSNNSKTSREQSRWKSNRRSKEVVTPHVNKSNAKKSKNEAGQRTVENSKAKGHVREKETEDNTGIETLSAVNEISEHSDVKLSMRKGMKDNLNSSNQKPKARKRKSTTVGNTKKVSESDVRERTIQQKSVKKTVTKLKIAKNDDTHSKISKRNITFENSDSDEENFQQNEMIENVSHQNTSSKSMKKTKHSTLKKNKTTTKKAPMNSLKHSNKSVKNCTYENAEKIGVDEEIENQDLMDNYLHDNTGHISDGEISDDYSVHVKPSTSKRNQISSVKKNTTARSRLKSVKSTRKVSLTTPLSTIVPKRGRMKKVIQLEDTPTNLMVQSVVSEKRKKKEIEESQRSEMTEFESEMVTSTPGRVSSISDHYQNSTFEETPKTPNQTNYMEMPTVLPNPKKLISPKTAVTPGVRRSKRIRSAPLEWFRNERLKYKKSKDGDWNIVGLLSPKNKETSKARKSKKKGEKTKKKKRLSAPRNQSLHQKIDDSYDLVPSSEILVRNPETEEEEMIDCVRIKDDYKFKGPTAQVPEPDDPFILCKTLAHKTFATGELILRPLQEKSTTILGKDSLVFIIMYGTLAVTIHNTSSVLGSEDTFYVPAGNTYRIQNLRDENAKLCYFQIKGRTS